jgi:hypothetical protein
VVDVGVAEDDRVMSWAERNSDGFLGLEQRSRAAATDRRRADAEPVTVQQHPRTDRGSAGWCAFDHERIV